MIHQDTSTRRSAAEQAHASSIEAASLPSAGETLTIKQLIARRKAQGRSTSMLEGTPWRKGFRFGGGGGKKR